MSQEAFRPPESGEIKRQIQHEIVSLADGPINLWLGSHRLQIIDPTRDLSLDPDSAYRLRSASIECLIIDPKDFNAQDDTGFKALYNGESMVLGRRHPYRFNFSH